MASVQRIYEVVVTDKHSNVRLHELMRTSTYRVNSLAHEYSTNKDYKGWKVWVRRLIQKPFMLSVGDWTTSTIRTGTSAVEEKLHEYASLNKAWEEWVDIKTQQDVLSNWITIDMDLSTNYTGEWKNLDATLLY